MRFPPLTHIFNVSFQTGQFPNKMKIAKIISVQNWRQIIPLHKLQAYFSSPAVFKNSGKTFQLQIR